MSKPFRDVSSGVGLGVVVTLPSRSARHGGRLGAHGGRERGALARMARMGRRTGDGARSPARFRDKGERSQTMQGKLTRQHGEAKRRRANNQ